MRQMKSRLLQMKPLSVLNTIAEHYYRDANDFASRFDLLWEAPAQLHKMGRIKSFIDLLMCCECALKCHVFLSHHAEAPREVYCKVRKYGHNIGRLADYATFLDDRSPYDHLKTNLGDFSVFLRYSLDAYETFFPSYMDRKDAEVNYSTTIGNNPWVLEIRSNLNTLLSSTQESFSGFVTDDLEALFTHEKQMKEFADSCLPCNQPRA